MTRISPRVLALCLVSLISCFSCTSRDLDAPQPLPSLDEAYFRCHVQPVLVKSCAALACHGDARRSFRVFGRNRMRSAGGEAQRNVVLRPEEQRADYDAARALVDPGDPDSSVLLRTALDARAGGGFHPGADFGFGNVFLSTDDPDYATLRAWTRGAKEDGTCAEP